METPNFNGWLDYRDVWFGVESKNQSCRELCGQTNDWNSESFEGLW